MKKFREGKIVVAEDYNKIVEILKKLKFNIKDIDESFPFIHFNSTGLAYGVYSNTVFHASTYPLITLDTLKQWVEEDKKFELVEKEFYYCEEDIMEDSCSSIFQFKKMGYSCINIYFNYQESYDRIDTDEQLSILHIFRPATQDEIQLLKDKVKEQTGKVFNEQTKIFEEPKKEVEFKPFDRVLGRDDETEEWAVDMFRICNFNGDFNGDFIYYCFRSFYHFCIPYEGNEHLLGTTNNPE